MKIFNKYSLLKEKCKDCGKNKKEIKGDFFYCSKCNKFISNGDKHNFVNFIKYDSLCKIHSNLYCFY